MQNVLAIPSPPAVHFPPSPSFLFARHSLSRLRHPSSPSALLPPPSSLRPPPASFHPLRRDLPPFRAGQKPFMDDLSEIYCPPEAPTPDARNPFGYDIYTVGIIGPALRLSRSR